MIWYIVGLKKRSKYIPQYFFFNSTMYPICNICIFGITSTCVRLWLPSIFGMWLDSVTNGSQNSPTWLYAKCTKPLSFQVLRPWTPKGHYGGPLDPTPINAPLTSLATLYFFFTGWAPPLRKTFRGPFPTNHRVEVSLGCTLCSVLTHIMHVECSFILAL